MAEFRQVISEKEIAEVVSLAHEIWHEHYVRVIGRDQVDYMLEKFQSVGAIGDALARKHEYFLVCDAGQRAVGYVGIAPDADESELQISKIYIQKQLRGRGLGKESLLFIEDICRQRGITKIWLTVNRNNSDSIAWYERMGFMNAGPTVKDIGGGFMMDDFIMEKKVGGRHVSVKSDRRSIGRYLPEKGKKK